jgi:cell division protein ZapA
MLDPTSVTVNIYGHEYTLRGEAEADYVQRLAAFVDRKMKEVAEHGSIASTTKVAILAAVNIADELFRERQQRHETLARFAERSGQISALLDREMGQL